MKQFFTRIKDAIGYFVVGVLLGYFFILVIVGILSPFALIILSILQACNIIYLPVWVYIALGGWFISDLALSIMFCEDDGDLIE